eukprot:CAMPEP_0178537530 /NCGR_PEP_ID=MMETSP0696-20121128/36642_1 /TAXON_ID=265572 /ORGANISM="Extubocellulus spinifer, Strain CCMP396" /LENGTH=485 /DNA_ID=CAMNT_0020169771 /DNA_START=104 /DNA_END=1561 /DNA_ORIENTATION=+
MPLESCIILLDNSEYMRNGDYVPTRLEAQHDAANLLVNHKTQSNPESTVGVIAMSGTTATTVGSGSGGGTSGAQLLVSPTDDMGKILAALHGVPTRGPGASTASGVDIPASVQVASLALKHRRNKNGMQRVVVFVGSPLGDEVDNRILQRAGRQLKKNNVAIDVVALGELEVNEERLRVLVDAANGTSGGGGSTDAGADGGGERTCNLVTIPPGVLPSDVLVTSPIVGGGGAGGGGGGMPGEGGGAAGGARGAGGGGDAFAEYGGIDPNMDPELAMALRVSMEEERARQERANAAAAASAAEESKDGGEEEAKDGDEDEGMEVDADGVPAAGGGGGAAAASGGGEDDEDALLQQALAMSMAESYAAPADADADAAVEEGNNKPSGAAAATTAATDAAPMEMDDDAEMQMALAMSMQDDGGAGGEEAAKAAPEFQDPQFVNQLLGSLPGVDPNDPDIQNALKNLKKDDDDDKDKDKDDKKKDGDEK